MFNELQSMMDVTKEGEKKPYLLSLSHLKSHDSAYTQSTFQITNNLSQQTAIKDPSYMGGGGGGKYAPYVGTAVGAAV